MDDGAPLPPAPSRSSPDSRRRARRDLAKMAGVLAVIAAVIALAWGPVERFFHPPETPLQAAVRAGDVVAARAHLRSAPGEQASATAYGAYEAALRSLSPSKPETADVLRLILEHSPQPRRYGFVTSQRRRSANLEFQPGRSSGMSSTADTTIAAVEIAAEQWSADGVRVLLDHGLDVKSVGVSSALTAAAANGCEPVIRLLLDAGADPNRPDRDRDTPLAMARRMKHDAIARLLIERGARN